MLPRERIRLLIFVPQLTAKIGHRTFLHFYYDGKSYSVRDFSVPRVAPAPKYCADLGYSAEELVHMARQPGAYSFPMPAIANTDIAYWHSKTVELNRRYLGIELKTQEAVAVTAVAITAKAPAGPSLKSFAPLGYREKLRAGFWKYSEDQFSGKDSFFDRAYCDPLNQPPVFDLAYAHLNVLVKPDASPEERRRVLTAIPDGMRHKWFRSMSSSQALAQSVFANLQCYGKLHLLNSIRNEDGVPVFPLNPLRQDYLGQRPHIELEHRVNYLNEARPTSVDVMIGRGYKVAVECKLSEVEVGSCSRPDLSPSASNYASDHCDGTYTRQLGRTERCPLTASGVRYWQYIPRLLTWPADSDVRPCPLRLTYQLVRNILAACVRPDGLLDTTGGHAVLLYDARNPDFGSLGKGYAAWAAVRSSLKNPMLLQRCTWQQVIACFEHDPDLAWLAEALRAKYGLRGGSA